MKKLTLFGSITSKLEPWELIHDNESQDDASLTEGNNPPRWNKQ